MYAKYQAAAPSHTCNQLDYVKQAMRAAYQHCSNGEMAADQSLVFCQVATVASLLLKLCRVSLKCAVLHSCKLSTSTVSEKCVLTRLAVSRWAGGG